MVNKESLKVSKNAKTFLERIMINRIKLEKDPLNSLSEAIELIQKYFKSNDNEYMKMIKEEKNVL